MGAHILVPKIERELNQLKVRRMNYEEIGLILSLINIIILIATLLVAFFEFRRSRKETRVKFVFELYGEFLGNKQIFETFRLFDYKNNEDLASNEIGIDQLLGFLENILALRAEGAIKERDFQRFEYYVRKTVLSSYCVGYFSRLSEHCQSEGILFVFPFLKKYQDDNSGVMYK